VKEYNIVISLPARQDISKLRRYIATELKEPLSAKKITDSINTAIASLDIFPQRYPVIEHEPYATRGIRKMLIENYIVFYEVNESVKKINVFRVIYNRRNWQMLI